MPLLHTDLRAAPLLPLPSPQLLRLLRLLAGAGAALPLGLLGAAAKQQARCHAASRSAAALHAHASLTSEAGARHACGRCLDLLLLLLGLLADTEYHARHVGPARLALLPLCRVAKAVMQCSVVVKKVIRLGWKAQRGVLRLLARKSYGKGELLVAACCS
jgi:hypothetical protein